MAKKKSKKEKTPMEKLTENYENFIKDKGINKKGKETFDKILKKATTPRSAK